MEGAFRMSREGALVKNTVILSIGNVLPKAVSFITLPILTACLTKAEYGTYDLINTLMSLFLPIVTLQIQTAAFRFLIDKRNDENGKKSIITNIYIFTGVVSVPALFILYFVLFKYSSSTKLLICSYFFLDMLIATSRQVIRGLGKNYIYSASSVLNSLINLVLIFLLVKTYAMGLNGLLSALVVALGVSQIYILLKIDIIQYIDISLLNTGQLKELLNYSWPMIPNSLSGWVMRLSDRLVISSFLGVEANAVYSVANKLPILYTVLQNTFTIAWQENASIVSKDKDTEKYYSEMFDTMYGLFFAIMAMLIATTPILFMILVKGDYADAYYQMPILYIGTFFNSLSSYMGGIYVAKMETKKVGITTMFAAICNLLIDFLLVNKVGIYAGSISTLVSYFILVVYRMYDVQKIQRMYFKFPKIIALLVGLIVMGILSYQKNLYLDVINFVFALVLSVFVNKNVLRMLLKVVFKKIAKR